MSEVVVGMCVRGVDDGEDVVLVYDMFLLFKEYEEFVIVCEEVCRVLGDVVDGGNDGVEVEFEKGILCNVIV